MPRGDNNPRIFAETIALDAWRTAFDGERGEADLHIDVVFSDGGRVGGEGAPVRFRLSLNRAEVRVVRDSEDVIEVKPDSVMRADQPEPGKSRKVTEKKTKLSGSVDGELSTTSSKLAVRGSGSGDLQVTNTLEEARSVPTMEVTHWKTDSGYGFKIASTKGRLKGQPWAAKTPVMKIKDTNARRKRGEPPEVRVEIHCLREDLVIERIEFTDSSFPIWKKLPHRKKIAVEQFIRDELARAGLPCGDLSDPFTRIILADAVPSAQL
jgi:hypothetical protein